MMLFMRYVPAFSFRVINNTDEKGQVYTLPLLPGYGASTKVRSSPAVKSPGGVSLLERMTEAEEVGYHDGFFPQVLEEGAVQTDGTRTNEYLLSSSPPQDGQGDVDTGRGSREVSPDVDKTFRTANEIPISPSSESPPGENNNIRLSTSDPGETTRLSTSDPGETTRLPASESETTTITTPTIASDPFPSPEDEQRSAARAHLIAERARATAQRRRRTRRRASDPASSSLNRVAEVVFFEYGVTVFFGLSEREERDVLEDCEQAGIWTRPVAEADWEVEECHYVSPCGEEAG